MAEVQRLQKIPGVQKLAQQQNLQSCSELEKNPFTFNFCLSPFFLSVFLVSALLVICFLQTCFWGFRG